MGRQCIQPGYIGQRDDLGGGGVRFYPATQNGMQFKTYGLFLEFSFNIFRLVDRG